MESIRLFAVDLDDTLLDSEWTISRTNNDALTLLADSGVNVCVISGRMPPAMKRLLQGLPWVRFTASYHGAIVQDSVTKKLLSSTPVDIADLARILKWAQEKDYLAIYFFADAAVATRRDDVVDFYEERTGVRIDIVDDLASKLAENALYKFFIYDPREPYNKGKGSISEERLFKEAKALVFPQSRYFKTGLGYIEFTHCLGTKSEALKQICDALEIPLEKTAAIGDGYNDLDMLAVAGTSFAVANANDAVKQTVDRIVSSNDLDGVAEAVHLILGNSVKRERQEAVDLI